MAVQNYSHRHLPPQDSLEDSMGDEARAAPTIAHGAATTGHGAAATAAHGAGLSTSLSEYRRAAHGAHHSDNFGENPSDDQTNNPRPCLGAESDADSGADSGVDSDANLGADPSVEPSEDHSEGADPIDESIADSSDASEDTKELRDDPDDDDPGDDDDPVDDSSAIMHLLPDLVLYKIFSFLLEQDLCRVAQVCTRFQYLADNPKLWQPLYKQVFEYDFPLFHPEPCVFKFLKLEECYDGNPWKTSFKDLYRGFHVSPGFKEYKLLGRNIRYFDTVQEALTYVRYFIDKSLTRGHIALIFLHAGTHQGEIVIDSNVALIGASKGVVRKSVILEGECKSTVKFVKGADIAYLGYLTLKFVSKLVPIDPNGNNHCLEITENCGPSVDTCVIRNYSAYGSAVRVSGEGAEPYMRCCRIAHSRSTGIIVENHAQGIYLLNEISRNRMTGIWVRTMANPVVRRNVFRHGHEVGIKVSDRGRGVFVLNNVHNNLVAALEVSGESNPLVARGILRSGATASVHIHHGGLGVFSENKITSDASPGILCTASNPTVVRNIISNSTVGLLLRANGRGWIEENNIFECTSAGICIMNSNPVIRQNKIHRCKLGIKVGDTGQGHIMENEVYANASQGVRIEMASSPIVQRNRIYSGKIGVLFRFGGYGELVDNIIFNNETCNIKIESTSHPNIHRNKISNGTNGGVVITNGGFGMLENNEIFKNSVAGVWIKNSSNPTLKRNKIYNSSGCGVLVVNNGKGKLEENIIFRNSGSGVVVCSRSNPTLRHNAILYCQGSGIDITTNASAILGYNKISHNKFSGISLATGVEPRLVGNMISNNEEIVEMAVADGQCLHAVSSNATKPLHDFYVCEACMIVDSDVAYSRVCVSCARTCHAGHAVSFMRRDRFECQCGAGKLRYRCLLQRATPEATEAAESNVLNVPNEPTESTEPVPLA